MRCSPAASVVGSGVVGQRAIRYPLQKPTRLFEGAESESRNLVGYFKSDLTIAEQLSVADPERLDQSLANLIANVGSC